MPLKLLNVTWCVTPSHIISFVQHFLLDHARFARTLSKVWTHVMIAMKFYPHISSISSRIRVSGLGVGSYNGLLVTPQVHHILALQGYSSEMDQ